MRKIDLKTAPSDPARHSDTSEPQKPRTAKASARTSALNLPPIPDFLLQMPIRVPKPINLKGKKLKVKIKWLVHFVRGTAQKNPIAPKGTVFKANLKTGLVTWEDRLGNDYDAQYTPRHIKDNIARGFWQPYTPERITSEELINYTFRLREPDFPQILWQWDVTSEEVVEVERDDDYDDDDYDTWEMLEPHTVKRFLNEKIWIPVEYLKQGKWIPVKLKSK